MDEPTSEEVAEVVVLEDDESGRTWRTARVIAVIAGIAALVWAMRDRFISLVVPREPEPPTFRVAPPRPAAPAAPEQEDLTVIAGIGPVYQSRLYAAGFDTLAAVAEASAAELSKAAQVPEGRAADWVSKAMTMVGKGG